MTQQAIMLTDEKNQTLFIKEYNFSILGTVQQKIQLSQNLCKQKMSLDSFENGASISLK